MDSVFLQEVQATILTFDLRDFTRMVSTLAPVELGINLSRFYEHVESFVAKKRGRVVKWMGDAVLCAWLFSENTDHGAAGIAALETARHSIQLPSRPVSRPSLPHDHQTNSDRPRMLGRGTEPHERLSKE